MFGKCSNLFRTSWQVSSLKRWTRDAISSRRSFTEKNSGNLACAISTNLREVDCSFERKHKKFTWQRESKLFEHLSAENADSVSMKMTPLSRPPILLGSVAKTLSIIHNWVFPQPDGPVTWQTTQTCHDRSPKLDDFHYLCTFMSFQTFIIVCWYIKRHLFLKWFKIGQNIKIINLKIRNHIWKTWINNGMLKE